MRGDQDRDYLDPDASSCHGPNLFVMEFYVIRPAGAMELVRRRRTKFRCPFGAKVVWAQIRFQADLGNEIKKKALDIPWESIYCMDTSIHFTQHKPQTNMHFQQT